MSTTDKKVALAAQRVGSKLHAKGITREHLQFGILIGDDVTRFFVFLYESLQDRNRIMFQHGMRTGHVRCSCSVYTVVEGECNPMAGRDIVERRSVAVENLQTGMVIVERVESGKTVKTRVETLERCISSRTKWHINGFGCVDGKEIVIVEEKK